MGGVYMKEERKKISLLTNLYDILFNNFVNNNIFDYKFYSMSNLILNGIDFNVSGKIVCIVLHFGFHKIFNAMAAHASASANA